MNLAERESTKYLNGTLEGVDHFGQGWLALRRLCGPSLRPQFDLVNGSRCWAMSLGCMQLNICVDAVELNLQSLTCFAGVLVTAAGCLVPVAFMLVSCASLPGAGSQKDCQKMITHAFLLFFHLSHLN